MTLHKFTMYSVIISLVLNFISTDRPQKTETAPIADRHTPLRIGTGVVSFLPKKAQGPYRIKIPTGPHAVTVEPPLAVLTEKAVTLTAEITAAPPVPAPTQQTATSPHPVIAAQSASGPVETAVAYALAQLGKPYVWGATGPSSFDCSGLVQKSFAQAGIKTTRTTKTLINEGSHIGRAQMIRGDLVFTSSGHVGIYLGNNEMVHAPQTGDVVKISTIWSFYAARRLI